MLQIHKIKGLFVTIAKWVHTKELHGPSLPLFIPQKFVIWRLIPQCGGADVVETLNKA
jgi:hypothetical protein